MIETNKAGDNRRDIQAHGAVLVCRSRDRKIVQCSQNAGDFLGMPLQLLLGNSIDTLFKRPQADFLSNELKRMPPSGPLEYLPPLRLVASRRAMEIAAYRSADHYVIEFEPENLDAEIAFFEQSDNIKDVTRAIFDTTSHETLLSMFAEKIRRICGFDRVVIYQLLEEGITQAIVESHRSGMRSMSTHRFPSRLVAHQGCESSANNRLQYFFDLRAPRVALIPSIVSGRSQPDWQNSILAFPLPLYTDDLIDRGVRTLMSIPLVVNGNLWGLILCLDGNPSITPHSLRMFCEASAHLLSMRLEEGADLSTSARDSTTLKDIPYFKGQLRK